MGWMSPSQRWLIVPAFVLVAGFATLFERLQGAPTPEAALAYWQRQVEAHPKFILGYSRLGLAYEGVQDWEGALRTYSAALAIDPSLEEAVVGKSGVVRRMRGRRAAIAVLSPYLADNPYCGVCSYNLASDHMALGEPSRARAQIDRALANIDSAPSGIYGGNLRFQALVLAGRIYTAAGEKREARAFLEAAIALNLDDVERAKRFLAQIEVPRSTLP